MPYTIDTFLSKVLYKKLCNGFHSIISNALKDSKENVASSSSSVISSLSVSKDREEANTKIKIAKSGHDSDSESSVGKITVSSVHTSELSSYDDNVSISSEEEGGGKKRVSLSDVKEKYLKRGKSNGPNYKKKKTGEMQSFSLNNKEDLTFECNEDKQVPEVESSVEDSPRKTLPPRIRKPNAKYASDSIICPVKLLSSTEKKENEVPSCSGEKSGSKIPLSAVRKRGRPKKSSIDSGGSSKTEMSHDLAQASPVRTSERHLRNGAEPPTSLECSSKYYESSDLYKPRPVFGRSGLRGNSAVTLFTTSVHNSKH